MTAAWLGQYCLNVADLDRSVAFYEALGLVVHEPHRDPAGLRGDRRAPHPRVEAAARPAEGPGRPGRAGHRLLEAVREHDRRRRAVRPGHRCGGHGRVEARAPRPLARDRGVRARPRRLPRRAGRARPVARRHPHRCAVARAVLPQRHRHRAHDRLLRAARPDLHQPHRDPPRPRGDPRASRPRREAAARPAARSGRAGRDGLDVEAVRQHRRLRGPARAGRRRRPPRRCWRRCASTAGP